MLRFIIKRLLYGFLVLIGVVSLVFFLFNILPGDPARMMLGQNEQISSIEAIRKDLGLDKSKSVQYFNYMNDLSPISFHNNDNQESYWFLDEEKYGSAITLFSIGSTTTILKKPYLRRSYQSKRRVSELIKEAFPKTFLLAICAISFALILGLLIGVISALKKDSFFDRTALVISVLGMSGPSFFIAIIFAWLFGFLLSDLTGLNMVGSLYAIDDFGNGKHLELKNLILPALTLGIRPLAVVVELSRNTMLDVLSQDYIRTAKAKGLSQYKVITRHALKNTLNPVITAISGWFASLIAGSVFVEFVFDWKGMGVLIVNALEKYDLPIIMGTVLFVAVLMIIINIFVDIIYSILDPRVRVT